jgi:predicted dehydrogenase
MKRVDSSSSRRDFLKSTGCLATASVLAGVAAPAVYAAGSDSIQVALIGCGGRGTGAAANALASKGGGLKLVAMADIFADRLKGSYNNLSKDGERGKSVDVPEDRRFIGLDAYKKAMDCLKPGDIAIFATPLAFRWVHFGYAIEKGLNVFMEKPLTSDGPTSRRMIALGEAADKKKLKVGVGLMSRHSRSLGDLAKRVHDGELGDIVLQRGYRMHGPIGFFASAPKPAGISDFMYQTKRFHSFLWAGGGCFSDFYIHIIDHLGWMKNAWPVKAQAVGGRHYREIDKGVLSVDQNFDSYSVEYTYADGAKFFMDGRCINGCTDIYSSYLHGTKGSAIASAGGDCGGPSSIYKAQNIVAADKIWESKGHPGEDDPYQNEWNDLVDAIRNDKPYNETKRGVEASAVTSMGRMAAHTGREITFEQFLNSKHEYAPGLDKMENWDAPAPLMPDKDGRYPVPQPGIVTDREY